MTSITEIIERNLAACHALALAEELVCTKCVLQKRAGYEVRAFGLEIILETRRDDRGMDRHRWWWGGSLVSDGAVGRGVVEIRGGTSGGGLWLMQIDRLALAWRAGMESAVRHPPCARRIVRPAPGRRHTTLRTRQTMRRAYSIDLAAAVVAHGEDMASDPSVRVRLLGDYAVAVSLLSHCILLSVHTKLGARILTTTIDRVGPRHVIETHGCQSLGVVKRLVATAGTRTQDDEARFRAYCKE